MSAKGISQSELARRVGVTQATIYRAVHGRIQGSKYIHVIARELGTTPAYLSGEVDDPGADAHRPALDRMESALLDVYRSLNDADRAALLRVSKAMTGGSSTVHSPKRDFGSEPADPLRK